MAVEEIEASENNRSVAHWATVTTLPSRVLLMEHYRETRNNPVDFSDNTLIRRWKLTGYGRVNLCGSTRSHDEPTYAEADRWNFSWFDSNEIVVDRLTDTTYAYLKRDSADNATASCFQSVAWKDIVAAFNRQLQGSLFDYPHRSVVQLTDFIQSLKETEHMDSPFDKAQLSERLNLYFEYSDLIEQVEEAHSQFESDFEDLSEYLRSNWEARLREAYDFEGSGWLASPSSNAKWQGLLPVYWDQDPLNSDSTIRLYFRHSPTTDSLRNRTLSFRLRLPPQRHVHTTPQGGGQSFNDVFTSLATTEMQADLTTLSRR